MDYTVHALRNPNVRPEQQRKLHITDERRGTFGHDIASYVESEMRTMNGSNQEKPLCSGCYLEAIANAVTELAMKNGDSLGHVWETLGHVAANQFMNVMMSGEPTQEMRDEFLRRAAIGDWSVLPKQEH